MTYHSALEISGINIVMALRNIFIFNIILLLTSSIISGCAYSKNEQKIKKDETVLAKDFEKARALKNIKHPKVTERVQHYKRNPAILTHLDSDRTVILRYILGELKKRNMPAELAMIPLVESSYKPTASNRGQHVGIWQFGAQTARNFGVPVHGDYDGRYNLQQSTKAALDYMQYLNKMFDGDWLLTMAAYNAGEGRVQKSIRDNEKKGQKTDFWSLSLPPVTRAYIPNVLALSEVVNSSPSLHVSKDDLPKLVHFSADTPEALKKVLDNSNITQEYLKFYNPNIARNKSGARSVMLPEEELRKIADLEEKNALTKVKISYAPTQTSNQAALVDKEPNKTVDKAPDNKSEATQSTEVLFNKEATNRAKNSNKKVVATPTPQTKLKTTTNEIADNKIVADKVDRAPQKIAPVKIKTDEVVQAAPQEIAPVKIEVNNEEKVIKRERMLKQLKSVETSLF